MNKIVKIALLCTMLGGAVVLNNAPSVANDFRNDLVETTTDLQRPGENVKEIQLGTSSIMDVSQTWVQYGSDSEGFEYLRFMTAVTGPVESVVYTRTSENLGSTQKSVTTVYKSVSVNGETWIYDGYTFGAIYDAMKNYYFACYTIKFNPDSVYKDEVISAYVTVTGTDGTVKTSTAASTSLNSRVPTCSLTYNDETGLGLSSANNYVALVSDGYSGLTDSQKITTGEYLDVGKEYYVKHSTARNLAENVEAIRILVQLDGKTVATFVNDAKVDNQISCNHTNFSFTIEEEGEVVVTISVVYEGAEEEATECVLTLDNQTGLTLNNFYVFDAEFFKTEEYVEYKYKTDEVLQLGVEYCVNFSSVNCGSKGVQVQITQNGSVLANYVKYPDAGFSNVQWNRSDILAGKEGLLFTPTANGSIVVTVSLVD